MQCLLSFGVKSIYAASSLWTALCTFGTFAVQYVYISRISFPGPVRYGQISSRILKKTNLLIVFIEWYQNAGFWGDRANNQRKGGDLCRPTFKCCLFFLGFFNIRWLTTSPGRKGMTWDSLVHTYLVRRYIYHIANFSPTHPTRYRFYKVNRFVYSCLFSTSITGSLH